MKVCKRCKSALINDQWIPTRNIHEGYVYVLCPKCEQEDSVEYQASLMSKVILDAPSILRHEKATYRQIYAIEKQFQTTGLNGKIRYIDRNKEKIIVETTHPLLAAQIGKKFHRLYRGKLTFTHYGVRGVLVHWVGNPEIPKPVNLNPVLKQAAA